MLIIDSDDADFFESLLWPARTGFRIDYYIDIYFQQNLLSPSLISRRRYSSPYKVLSRHNFIRHARVYYFDFWWKLACILHHEILSFAIKSYWGHYLFRRRHEPIPRQLLHTSASLPAEYLTPLAHATQNTPRELLKAPILFNGAASLPSILRVAWRWLFIDYYGLPQPLYTTYTIHRKEMSYILHIAHAAFLTILSYFGYSNTDSFLCAKVSTRLLYYYLRAFDFRAADDAWALVSLLLIFLTFIFAADYLG